MIVLFDGVCNLCSSAVQWIIPRDPAGRVQFATLQSDIGQRIAAQHHIDATQLNSIVVIDGNDCYTASTAALHICSALTWPWSWLHILRVIPATWRDAVYTFVARRRYRWFGQRATCMRPLPEHLHRFLG